MIKQSTREWRFMLAQRYVLVLLVCSFIVSGFAVVNGISEVTTQQQTIERLLAADLKDRQEAQKKYDDPGSLAYYTFHLNYSEPSNLAFAALGERDVHPWKHRIRMLALEGQIYESDAQNAELAQAGKIDFAFVISALSPLFIILLFHDLIASEKSSGRHDFLVATAQSTLQLWGTRTFVRFISLFICVMLPFFVGAIISDTALVDVLIVSLYCLAYFIFWTALTVWFGRRNSSAPRIASGLIGLWVVTAFVIPTLGDLAIKASVHSPKGGDILLVQREAVNDAWDLPVKTTMDAFVAKHPDYEDYTFRNEGFNWAWYYAFQQVGDQTAAVLSDDYRQASEKKYALAGYVSIVSPPLLIQRMLTRRAETDSLAARKYQQNIRDFHQQLREFYYPYFFGEADFNKSDLSEIPSFESTKK